MSDPKHMKWNILIFPGGTEIALEIVRSLKYCKEVRIFSASNKQLNHAEYAFVNHTIIPDVREPNWIEHLNQVIDKHKIDYIYPANPFVIDALTKNIDKLACKVIMSSPEVTEITRSKKRTLSLLKNVIPVPDLYQKEEITAYPVFVKPENGYGEQGASVVHSMIELEEKINKYSNLVIQEYLPGNEYTIDCFSDSHSQLLFCSGRMRARIRMGTSMHGALVNSKLQEVFAEIAEKINAKIPLTGAWFFQMKEDRNGNLKLLEVESRIAGTMALNRVRGINFPLLNIYQTANHPIKINTNDYSVTIDRALTNRYKHNLSYSTVYVDLDDTLILHKNKLNTELIQLLFQCINKGIKIILLSKSLADDKPGLLKKWKIFDIFDEIHWLDEAESKADYIKDKHSIFIDDSFSQRLEVSSRCNIATFDGSMIEMLLDERV